MTGVKLISTGGGSVTLDPGSTPNNAIITLPGTTGTIPSFASLTNNGVVYVNGSNQPTSGSALTFDGTTLATNQLNTSGVAYVGGSTAGLYLSGNTASHAYLVTNSSSTASDFIIGNNTNIPLIFNVNSAEQMRLTSTGLGIGTSSPAYILDATSASSTVAKFTKSGGASGYIVCGGSSANFSYDSSANNAWSASVDYVSAFTNGSRRLTIDSSGNLGLGVTPSAWYSTGWSALQVKQGLSLYGSGANDGSVVSNAYVTATSPAWTYIVSDYATRYAQTSGVHKWFTAPSGTAGNPITFTQAMTLDASGNLGVGTTTLTYGKLSVNAGASGTGNSLFLDITDGTYNPYLQVQHNGIAGMKIATNSTYGGAASNLTISPYANCVFETLNTERMRIDVNGNVVIGSTTANSKFHVYGGNIRTENTTSAAYNQITNTGGSFYFGIDSSSASAFSAGAYGRAIYSGGAYPLVIFTNDAERMRIDSAGNVLVTSGLIYGYQAAPTAKSTTATLTGAELVVGMLSTTGTSYTVTLPTGTNIDAAVSSSLAANGCFDWTVVNTASGTITIGANSNTTLGSLTIATGTSAQFRFRKTAANTYTVYRIS